MPVTEPMERLTRVAPVSNNAAELGLNGREARLFQYNLAIPDLNARDRFGGNARVHIRNLKLGDAKAGGFPCLVRRSYLMK